jgi:ATP-dependent exoDNAse (exonuclease V) beta subunit
MSPDAGARAAALQVDRQILLQAPAGSGKTTVLAQRFLGALATVDEPEEVLAITFTRKAAAEMRERVLLALEGGLQRDRPDYATWEALRSAALAHLAARGWRAEELPQRLRIQTIDSLAHEIARAAPLLGRMQSTLAVVDDAQGLYLEAARETLRYAETEPGYRDDVERLFNRLDNNHAQVEQLLAGMLPGRNRWLPWLVDHPADALAERVAASLRRIADATLRAARQSLPAAWWQEAARLARTTAGHRRDAGHAEEGPWRAWLSADAALDDDPAHWECWQAVAALLLREDGAPRSDKGITVRQGFPPTERTLKADWVAWRASAVQSDAAVAALRALQMLPPPLIDAEESEALAALARVLLLAAAQLQLVFRDHGLVDHGEVAAIARQVLRDPDGGGEALLRHTLRISHLLVDEFQDTSPEQLDLVRSLISGWDPGERRSLFLVGDPMQSIYLFRDSEVGLFLQVKAGGVGDLQLEPLQLTRNFRSQAALVQWTNAAFARLFPVVEDVRGSAVTFLAAEVARAPDSSLDAAVSIWPRADDDAEAEAADIAGEIVRLRALQPRCSVAVLVQTRALAGPILQALRTAGLPSVGVDLAALADRTVVRDLVALGQALLDAGDRAAWLAVLRAPACGLLLADLLQLCAAVGPTPLVEHLEDPAVQAQLSTDGAARLWRVAPVLAAAWRTRGSLDIASNTEHAWQQLGGEAACRDAGELAVARQYLLALRNLLAREGRVAPRRLAELAARLRDHGQGSGEHPVEVLTIHHAKGLEWDVVFVPGLGRRGRGDMPQLLRSLELPAAAAGDTDLLLAARSLGEPTASDPLSRYIAGLHSARQRNERLRLLYVAATRARLRLYLSGHAPPDKDGAPRPDGRSLLALLWPAVREHFAPLPVAPVVMAPARRLRMDWHRLPAQFALPSEPALPEVVSLARAQTEAGAALEFSWVGPLARAAGTVMHAELERLARSGEGAVVEPGARVAACMAQLREHGIDAGVAEATARRIVQRLATLATETRARWLLFTPHREAASELRLSGMVAGELRNVVIDRSFIDDTGTRWIIDYKTGEHGGGGLEEFVARELMRYAPQLRLYRALVRHLGPEPVRVALYFPWSGEFRELVDEPRADS